MSDFAGLVFDMDGVLIDSETFKIKTFLSLFTNFPEHLQSIDTYNRKTRGVNRLIKFEHIYNNILRLPYTDTVRENLATEYSKKLQKNLLESPLIDGVKEFLSQEKVPKFVATSSVKPEVESILKHHDILRYFHDIYTYPTSKLEAIESVIRNLNVEPSRVAFFGDALADYDAAKEAGATFIARNENPDLFATDIIRINNFLELL